MASTARPSLLLVTGLALAMLTGCSSGGDNQPSASDGDGPGAPAESATSYLATPAPTTTGSSPTTTGSSPTATATTEARFDMAELLGRDRVVILNVVPPLPDGSDLPLPTGMADFDRVFSNDTDWDEALRHVDVYRLHAWQLRYVLSDDQIRTMIDFLDEHDIAVMFETEPLTWDESLGCVHTESFSGVYDLEMAQRFFDLGGTFDAIAIEEPYHFVHKLDGPQNCQLPVERIVDEVIEYRDQLRVLFPGVPLGTIEPIWASPATTPQDMEVWLDTWEERAGEPFAFLHVDPDWYRPDWAEVAVRIEAVADARSVPFGVLYNGGQEPDSESWMQFAMENVAVFEQESGGTPQHVSFQSWVDQPDRALPPDDLGALTSGIVRYFGDRTTLAVSPPADGGGVTAALTTVDGAPVADAQVTARTRSLAGALGTRTVTGTVPDGVTEAVALIRVNIEGAVPGTVDARIASVSYREEGGPELVVNAGFGAGLDGWGVYGPTPGIVGPAGAGGESWLAISATSDQQALVDGTPFPVTPGASYEFTVRFGIDQTSSEAIDVAVEFPGAARIEMDMTPPTTDLATLRTDGDGRIRVPTDGLEPGSYQLDLDYDGDLDHWPTRASVTVDVG